MAISERTQRILNATTDENGPLRPYQWYLGDMLGRKLNEIARSTAYNLHGWMLRERTPAYWVGRGIYDASELIREPSEGISRATLYRLRIAMRRRPEIEALAAELRQPRRERLIVADLCAQSLFALAQTRSAAITELRETLEGGG